LKLRVNELKKLDNDVNTIQMGNIGAQLLNKMIRFVKPSLSKRATTSH